MVNKAYLDKVVKIVEGGKEGQQSIYNGLCAANLWCEEQGREAKEAIVLVHDSVRPLVANDLITRNIEDVQQYGNAITVIRPTETFNVMELARRCHTERVIIASTREVYGDVTKHKSVLAQQKAGAIASIDEKTFGGFDPMDNRSCYPESKRAEESIARSYYIQYGVPFNSIRMAHIYGPVMRTERDGRVMSDFINDAIHGRDIVLHSDGSAERAFCYLTDAIIGILHVAFKGEPGEAYNLSNESEPLPIREVAQKVCNASSHDIHASFEDAGNRAGYCQYTRVALNNHKIQNLGFTPKVTLDDGIRRTLFYFTINQH